MDQDASWKAPAAEPAGSVEEQHRFLMECVTDYAIILLDPQGKVAGWNAGAERLLGYTEAEILGLGLECFFTPEDQQAGLPRRELEQAATVGTAQDENWAVRKDGSRFWASGVTTGLPNEEPGRVLPNGHGGLRGFVKIFRDLTERRQSQAALRESEERLRVALAAARMGTWLWHIHEDWPALDESLRRLLGVADGRSVTSLEGFLGLIHPEDRPAVAAAFDRSARDGVPLSVEFRVGRHNDSARWIRVQGDAVHNGQQRPAYLTGAGVDITEHRSLEDELRRARDELERRVEERTAELVQAQQRMLQVERLAAIGQTVAAVAHEGRNALQKGQTRLERLRWRLHDQPEALGLAHQVQEALDDLLRMFEDVRGYAAPIRLRRCRCDLGELWREAWDELAALHAGREARLDEQSQGLDLTCEADPFRFRQVFRNLFDNSLAAARDPVIITIACAGEVVAGRPGLRMTVRDNGPGLGEEQRRMAFEPFFTTKPQGTGLGLAIARQVVEAHGGQITVGATTGPGGEFVIRLPCSRA